MSGRSWRNLGLGLVLSMILACGEEPAPRRIDPKQILGAPLDAAPEPRPIERTLPAEPRPGSDGLWTLDWRELMSFDYALPRRPDLGPKATTEREAQIPPGIRAWQGRRVRIDGFMMPIEVDGDSVLLFNLFHSLESCCFGTLAQITNWIEVELPSGKGVEYFPYGSIEVTGTLEVGELHVSGGVVAIYRLRGESAEPKW